ncbi:MAG TPA: hypothetical protein VNX70_03365 [Bryobacteraceae bacterium]|nr:hypothetical protein [Bryobacteraceae bacterium]
MFAFSHEDLVRAGGGLQLATIQKALVGGFVENFPQDRDDQAKQLT